MLFNRFKKTSRYLTVLFLMVFTCSCSISTDTDDKKTLNESQREYINIEKNRKIPLPFVEFDEENEYRQILTADYNGKKNSLLCIVKLKENGLSLTGLTLSSLPLFNLKYENKKLEGKYYVPRSMLPPINQVLFDIMLSFDRKNTLSNEISKEYIIIRDDNLVTLRKNDGKAIYKIEYAPYKNRLLPVKIVNQEFNYSITLKYL